MDSVIVLNAGDACARLVPSAGGRVSALRLVRPNGKVSDVLYPYPEDFFDPIHWAKGSIYPLMPYSNRIANSVVRVKDEDFPLRPHPNALPHTLHGNAHAQGWQVDQVTGTSATLSLDSLAGPAWPWRYTAQMRLQLTPSELQIQLTLRNADQRIMPAGLGLHPYFSHEPDALVSYEASTLWPATAAFLPGAERPLKVGEQYERPRRLPDGTMTDYVGGWDGTALVDLPQGGRLAMHADPLFGHLVVHRPDTPIYLCLEPVSHVADGFNLAERGVSNTGAQLLEPSASLSGAIRFEMTS